MYKIVAKKELARKIKLMKVQAPEVAEKAQAGQFVIVRVNETCERIPLTLVDWNKQEGTITLIFLETGVSTEKLGMLEVGDFVSDVCGPLGNPTHVKQYGTVCVIGGGVGTASTLPIIRAMKKAGNMVIAIVAAKSAGLLILENEIAKIADELHVSTDDGTKGYKGFANELLESLIDKGVKFDIVYAIGPTVMMRAVANTTRAHSIKTVVSLNPIMVDGMGMCGACRVTVDGRTRFACVDGPEFDAHQVDFAELLKRQGAFVNEEKLAMHRLQEKGCSCNE